MPVPMPGRFLSPLLDFVHPQRCVWCGASPWDVPWFPAGPPVAGLRPWDRTHSCRRCIGERLPADAGEDPVMRILDCGIEARGAVWSDRDLARAVGAWKYHGVRGLAWPLGELVEKAAPFLLGDLPNRCPHVFVPIPLHARRRRSRGFNQAEILAGSLALATGGTVRADLVRRVRETGQQARLGDASERFANLQGAFRTADLSTVSVPGADLVLVDDLVTSGATAGEAAAALRAGGLSAARVVCIGLARPG
ncbi:MAG: hypothetical protein ABIK96_14690 [bacterium]